jgi:aspartyl-tRNA(Asn)/glutamyl-tRNA(Gln) amidotransferase subunit A
VNGDPDPARLTIAQAREAIQRRQLSSVELLAAVLARVEREGSRLNAYLHLDPDAALAEARSVDRHHGRGPLQGIPICVKDVIDVAGVPTTAGAAGWVHTPDRDAPAVARLRAAGAIVIGKGHTNEFAYGIDGRNPHFGDCHNPHDPTRLSGGSSSGPAVATATGMAMAGLGTDTSGSIRVPASLCGVVGIRPTLGLVPDAGVIPLAWSYDVVGPLARTVFDAAILLEVLAGGSGTGDAGPEALERYLDAGAERELRGLRIGIMEQLVEYAEPYVAEAVIAMAGALAADGAEVTPVTLDLLPYINAIHQLVQHAEAAQAHQPWFDGQRPLYSQPVRVRLEAGRVLPAAAYLTAQQARRLVIDEVADRLNGLDAMLAPTTPLVAPPGDSEEVTIRGAVHNVRAALLRCTIPPSQFGCPVVSLPIGSHDGLPFGMQIIGRPFSERLLLALAAACERRCGALLPPEVS